MKYFGNGETIKDYLHEHRRSMLIDISSIQMNQIKKDGINKITEINKKKYSIPAILFDTPQKLSKGISNNNSNNIVINYSTIVRGNLKTLHYKPTVYSNAIYFESLEDSINNVATVKFEIEIEKGEIRDLDKESINRIINDRFNEKTSEFFSNIRFINKEIQSFNSSLEELIQKSINDQIDNLNDNDAILDSIDIN